MSKSITLWCYLVNRFGIFSLTALLLYSKKADQCGQIAVRGALIDSSRHHHHHQHGHLEGPSFSLFLLFFFSRSVQRQLPERALHSLLTLIAGGLVRARPPVEVALKGLVVQVRNGKCSENVAHLMSKLGRGGGVCRLAKFTFFLFSSVSVFLCVLSEGFNCEKTFLFLVKLFLSPFSVFARFYSYCFFCLCVS